MDYIRLCLLWQVNAWMTTAHAFTPAHPKAFDEPMRRPVAMVTHDPLYIPARFQDIPSEPTPVLAS